MSTALRVISALWLWPSMTKVYIKIGKIGVNPVFLLYTPNIYNLLEVFGRYVGAIP